MPFKTLLHTDATQAVGRIPVDVRQLGVDLASVSAHKLYGPKGAGCLYVRRGMRSSHRFMAEAMKPGFRSGTTNVPGAVGFGKAAELARTKMAQEMSRSVELVERLVGGLREALSGVEIISESAPRLPNTVNVRFAGADGEAVMVNAPGVLISSGSACTAMIPDASHVLQRMGMPQEQAYECLRFSTGRPTTEAEIDAAVKQIALAVKRVRLLTDPGDER